MKLVLHKNCTYKHAPGFMVRITLLVLCNGILSRASLMLLKSPVPSWLTLILTLFISAFLNFKSRTLLPILPVGSCVSVCRLYFRIILVTKIFDIPRYPTIVVFFFLRFQQRRYFQRQSWEGGRGGREELEYCILKPWDWVLLAVLCCKLV